MDAVNEILVLPLAQWELKWEESPNRCPILNLAQPLLLVGMDAECFSLFLPMATYGRLATDALASSSGPVNTETAQ